MMKEKTSAPVERVTGIEKKYNDRTHTLGRIWGVVALVVFMMIPVSISIHLGAWPIGKAFAAAIPLFLVCGLGGIGEDIMYTTLIGPSATYVSFLTGNISNLKFPCTVAALESADADIHSDEGEVLATLAVCVSSIVTVLVIAVFCLALSPLIPLMTKPTSVVYPAFKHVLPALFGAISLPYMVKNPKIWEIPMLVLVLLYWFVPGLSLTYAMFAGVVISLVGAFVMYKAGWLTPKDSKQETHKVAIDMESVSEDIKEDIPDDKYEL